MFNTPNVLAAIEQRALIKEIVTVEPVIQDILLEAAARPPHTNRWRVYADLQQKLYPYIGHAARSPQIASTRHYEAFMNFLDTILVEDEIIEEAFPELAEDEEEEDCYI